MQNVDFWMKNDRGRFHLHLEGEGPSKLNMKVGWKDQNCNAALSRREARALAWMLLYLSEDISWR